MCARRHHRHAGRPGRRFGYTLIEMLAVLVLLALASGAGVAMLSGSSTAVRMREAAASVRDLDARARALAESGVGAVVIRETDGGLVARALADGAPLAEVRTPAGIVARLHGRVGGRSVNQVLLGRDGRGEDYRVLVESGDHRITLEFAGLTGWAVEGSAQRLGGGGGR